MRPARPESDQRVQGKVVDRVTNELCAAQDSFELETEPLSYGSTANVLDGGPDLDSPDPSVSAQVLNEAARSTGRKSMSLRLCVDPITEIRYPCVGIDPSAN
jgi:hypothetical protein